MDIKGENDRNIVIAGDFNTSLTSTGRSSRENINEVTAALNDILDQMYLIGIFRVFHPKGEYRFFFKYTWNVF